MAPSPRDSIWTCPAGHLWSFGYSSRGTTATHMCVSGSPFLPHPRPTTCPQAIPVSMSVKFSHWLAADERWPPAPAGQYNPLIKHPLVLARKPLGNISSGKTTIKRDGWGNCAWLKGEILFLVEKWALKNVRPAEDNYPAGDAQVQRAVNPF